MCATVCFKADRNVCADSWPTPKSYLSHLYHRACHGGKCYRIKTLGEDGVCQLPELQADFSGRSSCSSFRRLFLVEAVDVRRI